MGTQVQDRKPEPGARRSIVAFDFDGTLTATDSFLAFIRWRSKATDLARAALRLAPSAARYLVDRDRGALKASTMRAAFGGVTLDALCTEAAAFCDDRYDALIRPDALERWTSHGRAGDERVIVTASPEPLVAPFAARLGADRLIATRLVVGADGRVDGALDGPNCRGEQKVTRLRAIYGPEVRLAAAYGDTIGDREMLAIADAPGLRVFTRVAGG